MSLRISCIQTCVLLLYDCKQRRTIHLHAFTPLRRVLEHAYTHPRLQSVLVSTSLSTGFKLMSLIDHP